MKEFLKSAGSIVLYLGLFFGFLALVGGGTQSSSSSSYSEPSSYSNTSDAFGDSSSGYEEEPSTFSGYTCTSDCSGHEAGYDWAYENDVCDEYFDGGNSESFAEGVRAYAEENCSSGDEEEYYDEDYDYYR